MTKAKDNQAKEARNVYRIPVDLIVADETVRGRHKAPPQKDVEALAHSIKEHGQLQAVMVRKITKGDNKGKYQLSLGFTRFYAIKWGNETGLFSPELPILAATATMNDEESFTRNVVENRHRNQTTAVDDAHNMRRLREDYGKSNADISRLYNVSQAYVSQLTKLLTLPASIQNKVADGKLTLSGALMLADADVPSGELPEIIKSSTDENGKVNTGLLKQTLRGITQEDSDTENVEEEQSEDDIFDKEPTKPQPRKTNPPPEKPTPKYPRSLKEIKAYWNEQTGIADPPAIGEFAKKMLAHLNGEISDKSMDKAFDKLVDGLKSE